MFLLMINWYLGTMGFAYKAWRGLFYPPEMASQDYLAAYSRIFNAVELDSTFYGVPRLELVSRWSEQVPAEFKFCPKTPKTITHQFQLSQAVHDMLNFLKVIRRFGDKLGPVLLQWPPDFTNQQSSDLEAFLKALPTDIRYACEFRHDTWYAPETSDLLTQHRVAWVSVDYVHSPRHIDPTTDFLYIRWLGQHGRFERGRGARLEVSAQLEWWREAIKPHLNQIPAIYGFFNDDFAGHGPDTCNQFKEIVGLPAQYPDFPRQSTLF
jgi:uncharacterized protein YecE (DUF72 family)